MQKKLDFFSGTEYNKDKMFVSYLKFYTNTKAQDKSVFEDEWYVLHSEGGISIVSK